MPSNDPRKASDLALSPLPARELERAQDLAMRLTAARATAQSMYLTVSEGRGYRPEYVEKLRREAVALGSALQYAELAAQALRTAHSLAGDHPGR